MYCKNCGNELSDDARFCEKCGLGIDSSLNEPEAAPAAEEALETVSEQEAEPVAVASEAEETPKVAEQVNTEAEKPKMKRGAVGAIIAAALVLLLGLSCAGEVLWQKAIKPAFGTVISGKDTPSISEATSALTEATDDEPEADSDEPETADDEPKTADEEPEPDVSEPEVAEDEPEAVTESSEEITKLPEVAAEIPEALSELPESFGDYPLRIESETGEVKVLTGIYDYDEQGGCDYYMEFDYVGDTVRCYIYYYDELYYIFHYGFDPQTGYITEQEYSADGTLWWEGTYISDYLFAGFATSFYEAVWCEAGSGAYNNEFTVLVLMFAAMLDDSLDIQETEYTPDGDLCKMAFYDESGTYYYSIYWEYNSSADALSKMEWWKTLDISTVGAGLYLFDMSVTEVATSVETRMAYHFDDEGYPLDLIYISQNYGYEYYVFTYSTIPA